MTHRILVVEDNEANRELVSDWLEAEGFDVIHAANLDQANAALKGELPSVILLDVQLGPEDGLTLATAIRRDPALCQLPIIAVTAHAMVTDHERVMQAGCNACVSKPIDFRALRAQLDRWIGVATNLPPRE